MFRGSDVKDLRIEQEPEAKPAKPPPQVPDDPAILGVSACAVLCDDECILIPSFVDMTGT